MARHGSRGLSSIKYDLALYNLWKQAKAENALTALGEKLGADLEKMMNYDTSGRSDDAFQLHQYEIT